MTSYEMLKSFSQLYEFGLSEAELYDNMRARILK